MQTPKIQESTSRPGTMLYPVIPYPQGLEALCRKLAELFKTGEIKLEAKR